MLMIHNNQMQALCISLNMHLYLAQGMLLALRLDDARVGAEDYGGILVALSPNPVSDGGGYSALIGET